MATPGESIVDGLIWLGRLLRTWTKWAVILGSFIGLFVLAAWFTRGEDFGDCGEVTAEQRLVLDSLQQPQEDRSFLTAMPGRCIRGVFVAPVEGLGGDLDEVVDRLAAEGWVLEATLLPLDYDLRVRCLRLDEPGFETIELSIAASRAGEISRAEIRATEGQAPCEPYRCASLSTGCQRFDRLEAGT